MDGVLSSFDRSKTLEYESIAAEMFASRSPEELLKIFLTNLGEQLGISRVAIYQLTNQDEGLVLVEAIAPNISTIKNQPYPVTYFGVRSLADYPQDRAVRLPNVAQTQAVLSVHQLWQRTKIKAMMSAPILFDALAGDKKIWGLTFVQQCDRPRCWQPQEAILLYELSQVLGQCLQFWELSLRSNPNSPALLTSINNYNDGYNDGNSDGNNRKYDANQYTYNNYSNYDRQEDDDQEEFIARRVELSQDLEVPPASIDLSTDIIAMSNNFTLSDDEENEILERLRVNEKKTSIYHAVNHAMQQLDRSLLPNSGLYSPLFDTLALDTEQNMSSIDLESITLEDVLESFNQESDNDPFQAKVDYLQKRVGELIESMQQKLEEIESLQCQVKNLTASQQEFRRILLDLQSENLTQNIKDTIIAMYQSFLTK
ncbi:GAF domain-containing protein [Pseudanabaena sp. 'Roaring Creek']|uniref:GAF domain-containing protein n=1 Tax=Pseudanabaena sp. 'Roaring Creek' TaxID=1681830 RepID=UPI0006D7E07B|nr:GAF domain-containing protein [Pseudanabaena sp. 'Roaring Creek']